MKKLIIGAMLLSGCATLNPQTEVKQIELDKSKQEYTFKFPAITAFFYRSEDQKSLLMFQPSDLSGGIPEVFTYKDKNGKDMKLKIFYIYPEPEKVKGVK